MSDVIDTSVVELQFDSEQFINGVSQTIDTVDQLKDSLTFDSRSFDSLTRAANNVDLSGISASLEAIQERFSTFGIVGMTAVQRITNEIMTLMGKLAKLAAKPWQQILTGGTNRAANIEQATFQLQGLYGKTEEGAAKLAMTMNADADAIYRLTGYTEDMVVAMDAANYAVADTAYGLDSAAKAASVLATSGINVTEFSEDLRDSAGKMRTEMQVALRAISGTAAMANAQYDDIAHTFERVAGNGRVMAIDLQSFSARGLNAAATLRDYLNEVGETANATESDIRDMVSKGQISFMTLAKAMDSTYGDHAKDANNTFTGALSNMKFALSKIGADFIAPFRERMIPLFNDLRLSIKNVQKALNFKMKFPGLEEEVSIVDLFTRSVTKMANKLHDLFAIWMGGQDVMTKAITGLNHVTGIGFAPLKKIFDEATKGTKSASDAIDEILTLSTKNGESLNSVIKQLAENLDKTEDEVIEMCKNGEVSFEQFSNAVSAVFGNTVWDNRVSQFAQIFQNLVRIVGNLGDAVGAIVYPIVKAFFDVFKGPGVDGVVGATSAIADFTSGLIISTKSMKGIYGAASGVAKVLKLVFKAAISIVKVFGKIIKAIAPLLKVLAALALGIVTVVTSLVDAVAESEAFSAVIRVLSAILLGAGKAIIFVFAGIASVVGPAIRAVASFFYTMMRGLSTIDFNAFKSILAGFGLIVQSFFTGGVINKIKAALVEFAKTISEFFNKIEVSFTNFKNVLAGIVLSIGAACVKIGQFLVELVAKIKILVAKIIAFFSDMEKVKTLIGAIAEVITVIAITSFVKSISDIASVISAVGKKLKSEEFLNTANAIKTVATAVLILSAAILVLSLIDNSKIPIIVATLISIIGVLFMISLVINAIAKLQTAKNAEKTPTALEILANGINSFLNNVADGITKFLKRTSMAALILAFAASLLILYKAIEGFASIPFEEMRDGLEKIIVVGSVIVAAMGLLALTLHNFDKATGGGLIGVAIAMMAFTVTLKMLEDVIREYYAFDPEEFGDGLSRVAWALFVVAGAAALIAAACKKSGTAMMQSAIVMLGFLVILNHMTETIELYKDIFGDKEKWKQAASALLGMAAVLLLMTGGIYVLSKALGDSASSFSASLKEGVKFNKASKQLMGVTIVLLAFAVVCKVMTSVMKDINEVGFNGWIWTIALIATVFAGMAALLEQLHGINDAKPAWSIVGMFVAIAVLLIPLTLMDTLSMAAAAGAICLILVSIGETLKTINSLNFSKKTVGIIFELIVVLGAVGGVILALKKLDGDWQSMLGLSAAISILLFTLSKSLAGLNNVQLNIKAVGQLALVLLALVGISYFMNKIEVVDPVGLLALSAAISIVGVIGAVIVQLISNSHVNPQDLIGFVVVIAAISGLALALGNAARICADNYDALPALTNSLMWISVIAAILTMVLAATSKISTNLTGAGAFFILMATIAGFAALIACIAKIGDVNNTIALLDGMAKAFMTMLPFLAGMQLVISLLGLLGPMALIGNAVFLLLMATIAGFAALIACIAKIGDVNNTIAVMEALAEMMDSLTWTFLKVIVIGALGVFALAGIGIIQSSVLALVGLCAILGKASSITAAAIAGLNTITLIVETLATDVTIMGGINLNSIMNFIQAIALLSNIGVPLAIKLFATTMGLAVAMKPLIDISKKGVKILAGVGILRIVMDQLKKIFDIGKEIASFNVAAVYDTTLGIIDAVSKTVKIASYYTVTGFVHGLIDPTSQAFLKTGAVGMATLFENYFRDYMGIHSDSDLFIKIAHFVAGGFRTGVRDSKAQALLGEGATDMSAIFGTNAMSSLSSWGELGADSYMSGFLTEMGGFDLSSIDSIFSDAGAKAGKASKASTFRRSNNGRRKNVEGEHVNPNYRGNFQSYEEYLKYMETSSEKAAEEAEDPWTKFQHMITDSFKDMPDIDSLIGKLGDTTDMTAMSMDGLGDSMTGVGASSDKLKDKIDDLMDKYEEVWDNAKENANKDLFKGVDDQGDDFLSKIQDIMDQYENIFTTAVERTNDQDLFAEVKEDAESFAPETLLKNLQDQVGQITELNTIITSLSQRITDENLREAISHMDVDKLPQLRAMYRMSASELGEYEKLYQDKVMANQEKIQNELTGDLSQITGEYTNVASYIATDESTNQLVANLQAQIDQLNRYNEVVASLMHRVTDMNLREAIAKQGVDALPELEKLNAMSDEMLNRYSGMYNQKIAQEARSLKNELSAELSAAMGEPLDISEFYAQYKLGMTKLEEDIKSDDATINAGKTAGNTIAGAMASDDSKVVASTSGKKLVNELATGTGDEDAKNRAIANINLIIDEIYQVLDDSCTEFQKKGSAIVDAICGGIDTERRTDAVFAKCINNIVDDIYNIIEIAEPIYESCGAFISLGMAAGIEAHAYRVSTAALEMVKTAVDECNQYLQIDSPSKVFTKIGRFMDEGLAIGINRYAGLASDASENMAYSSLSVVQEAIDHLSGMLDGSIDVNPVITPTLDLSEVNARSAALANMFTGRQIAVQARADEQQAEMMNQLGNILAEQNSEPRSITFNQTNNSPKALSKAEIYRQTRNGFSQLVSAIS